MSTTDAFTIQDVWTSVSDFPFIRYDAASFTIGDKVYVGTGQGDGDRGNNTRQGDLWEYNTSTDTWSQKADYTNGLEVAGAVSFAIGNKGYMGTGTFSNGTLRNFREYDPNTNNWTVITSYPTFTGAAVAFAIGNKGYVGTGASGSDANKFWEYDPNTDTWTQKADIGGGARFRAFAFSTGGKGYIGGGSFSGTEYDDFWEYDPTTDTWAQKADFGGGVITNAAAFGAAGKGYVGTGSGGENFILSLWEYNPEDNTWTERAEYPGGGRSAAIGFSVDDVGYIGTGVDGAVNGLKSMYKYQPVTN